MKHIKGLVVIMCLFCLFTSIGYAQLSGTLTIEGSVTVEEPDGIYIQNAVAADQSDVTVTQYVGNILTVLRRVIERLLPELRLSCGNLEYVCALRGFNQQLVFALGLCVVNVAELYKEVAAGSKEAVVVELERGHSEEERALLTLGRACEEVGCGISLNAGGTLYENKSYGVE